MIEDSGRNNDDYDNNNKRKLDSILVSHGKETRGAALMEKWEKEMEDRDKKVRFDAHHMIDDDIARMSRVALGSETKLDSDRDGLEYKGRVVYGEGCIDSGATAMMIDLRTAEQLEVEGFGEIVFYDESSLPKVEYAGGDVSCANIIGYIMGDGKLVSKLEIVDDLNTNLIGIRYYIDRDMKVEFSKSGVYVSKFSSSGEIINKRLLGYFDEDTGLFMGDLRAMLGSSSRFVVLPTYTLKTGRPRRHPPRLRPTAHVLIPCTASSHPLLPPSPPAAAALLPVALVSIPGSQR